MNLAGRVYFLLFYETAQLLKIDEATTLVHSSIRSTQDLSKRDERTEEAGVEAGIEGGVEAGAEFRCWKAEGVTGEVGAEKGEGVMDIALTRNIGTDNIIPVLFLVIFDV